MKGRTLIRDPCIEHGWAMGECGRPWEIKLQGLRARSRALEAFTKSPDFSVWTVGSS